MKQDIISEKQQRAVNLCLYYNLPFALVGRPGKPLQFMASVPSEDECRNEWASTDPDWDGFIINFFANDEEYVAGVRNVFNEDTVIDFIESNHEFYPPSLIEPPCSESTDRLKYIAMATSIVSRLKREGGKTVFSRVVVENSSRNVVSVAERYFSHFPSTFRYLCFTQETGVWLGATPEVVADYTLSTGLLHTMALAGTMLSDDSEWDNKNIEEHAFVTGYIFNVLESLGATKIMEADPEELHFGPVKHLLTPIKAYLKTPNPRGMLYSLSPTPAVAGTPRDRAISEIFLCETHNRLCYGGFVGLKEGNKLRVWANLRCATVRTDESHPDKEHFTYYIYAGGGLTSRSVPADEWEEGQAKTCLLQEAVKSDY